MGEGATYERIDSIFRQSYSQIVSTLLDRFGMTELDVIENAVMDAFYKALKVWPFQGIPSNQKGWLYKVSYRKLLDDLRKKHRQNLGLDGIIAGIEESDEIFDDHEIQDPELRLLFIVCHPELKPEDQIAFMLKLVSGFGVREIANALLQQEATIKKRLSRARKFIREEEIKFEWPNKSDIPKRRKRVHQVLYLLFNEGYSSSHPEKWVHKDFCLEAMRLCKYLVDHPLANHDSFALMSLMCYHISRFESRTDMDHNLILLRDQDRSKWNTYFINLGHRYLEKSANLTNEKTSYQIEAFISAQHCLAPTLEKTDWSLLKLLYEKLHELRPNRLIVLNRVIVMIQLNELTEAKELFDELKAEDFKTHKSSYFIVGAELYAKLKDTYQAKYWIQKAVENSHSSKEGHFLQRKYSMS